jgi:hypothetical protein
MSNKQTAVQILVDSLIKLGYLHSNEFGQSPKVRELINQAKEIEKQRMIGLLQWMNRVTQSNPMRLETDDDDVVEQYYLETYGGNK